jgi:hypothetical protein
VAETCTAHWRNGPVQGSALAGSVETAEIAARRAAARRSEDFMTGSR